MVVRFLKVGGQVGVGAGCATTRGMWVMGWDGQRQAPLARIVKFPMSVARRSSAAFGEGCPRAVAQV